MVFKGGRKAGNLEKVKTGGPQDSMGTRFACWDMGEKTRRGKREKSRKEGGRRLETNLAA